VDLSGEVIIRLPANVQVCRPQVAEKLFTGRAVSQVVVMIPMLYSLCAQAQQLAARLTLFGAAPDQDTLRAVALEAVREHGLYLARWLPDLQFVLRGIAGWQQLERSALQEKLQAVAEAAVGFPEISKSAKIAAEMLPEKAQKTAPEGVLSLYEQDFAADILHLMARQPGWCQKPSVAGVRENSFYTRAATYDDFTPDAAGRIAARWWDLHQWLKVALGESAPFPQWGMHEADGWRMGWVETARGRLYHAARVDGAQVVAYRISAPTEWNFHPQGVLAQWLKGLTAPDQDTALALAQLIDPCVAVRMDEA